MFLSGSKSGSYVQEASKASSQSSHLATRYIDAPPIVCALTLVSVEAEGEKASST